MDTRTGTIEDQVVEIVRGFAGDAGKALEAGDVRDLNLIEDLGLDSVRILNLLMEVEERFGVALDDADVDLEDLMRIGALADFVARTR